MNEKIAYQKFREKAIKPLDRCDRIENVVGVGNPDVNFCIEGIEGWIEIKCPKEPKKPLTPLFGSNHKLSQAQMNWFLRQRNSGGVGWVLIVTDKNRWILIDGCKYGDEINFLSVNLLVSKAAFKAVHPDSTDFLFMRNTLMSKKGEIDGI